MNYRFFIWILLGSILIIVGGVSIKKGSLELTAGNARETVVEAYKNSVLVETSSDLTINKTGDKVKIPKDIPGYTFVIHGMQKGTVRIIEIDQQKIPMITTGMFFGAGFMKVISLKEHPELIQKMNLSRDLIEFEYLLFVQSSILAFIGLTLILSLLMLRFIVKLFL